MHKKLLPILTALFLSLALAVPAAAAEYGPVYLEAPELESDALIALGTQTLPEFTEASGIDLRVDVLTSTGDFTDLSAAAAYLYDECGYGYGEDRTGVSLTLYVYEDDTGYAMDGWLNGWVLYAVGDDELCDYVNNTLTNSDINDYLNMAAWDGDADEDAYALSMAVETLVSKLSARYAPDSVPASGTALYMEGRNYVFDTAGLLSEDEAEKLEAAAQELSAAHSFGVYIVTVDDYLDYSSTDVFHAALNIYHSSDFGVGTDKNGVMLLLSMADRDLNLMSNGTFGQYAFNDDGRYALTDFLMPDLGENEWYDAFKEYLTWAGRYLEEAEQGTPYSAENEPWDPFSRNLSIIVLVLLIALVPLIPAFIFRSILVRMMKSVEKGSEASAYVSGNLQLTKENDRYTRTTVSKRYNPPKKDSGSGGSGGVTHQHSGSASGTSRKF